MRGGTFVYMRKGKRRRGAGGICTTAAPVRLGDVAAPEPLQVPDSQPLVRLRRVEDHGRIMSLFKEPSNPQLSELLSGPSLRRELAGAQKQQVQRAVCEVCADRPALSAPRWVLSPQRGRVLSGQRSRIRLGRVLELLPAHGGARGRWDEQLVCVCRATESWLVSSAPAVTWTQTC